jgi:hypothetical protein
LRQDPIWDISALLEVWSPGLLPGILHKARGPHHLLFPWDSVMAILIEVIEYAMSTFYK